MIAEDVLRQLEGLKGVKVFREMQYVDPTVGALLFAIEMMIRRVPWRTEQGDATEEDAAFLESCRNDMSTTWADLLADVLSFLVYGWAYFEVVYKYRRGESVNPAERSMYDDNKIGWRKIVLRSQDSLSRWQLGSDGGVEGMVQQAPPDYREVIIPISKALLFRTSVHKNNPQGRSILYNAYRPWYMKKHIENIEAVGVERDLAGFPVIYVPEAYLDTANKDPAVTAARDAFYQIVRRMKRDEQEGLLMPSRYDDHGNKMFQVELLTTGGRRSFDTSAIITRCDQQIARIVVADFLTLGASSTGSFALSKDKTDLFTEAIGAWLSTIADVFNRHAVPKLFRLNGNNAENLPHLQPGKLRAIDIEAVGAFLLRMTQAGAPIFPNKTLLDDLFEEVGLPPVALEDSPEEALPDPVQGALPGREPSDVVKPLDVNAVDPQSALNGAQVSALLDVISQVATRKLPRETGVAIITSSFPLSKDQAEAVMGAVGQTFFVEVQAPPMVNNPMIPPKQEKQPDDDTPKP